MTRYLSYEEKKVIGIEEVKVASQERLSPISQSKKVND